MPFIVSEAATEQIIWSEGFSTGIAEVDDQHRVLLKLIDEVRVLVANQRHQDPHLRLGPILDQLNEYATSHFLTEETLLRQYLAEDAGTDAHIQSHRNYLSTIAGHQKQMRHGQAQVCSDLYRFLRQWWIGHILTTDQEMRTALRPPAVAR